MHPLHASTSRHASLSTVRQSPYTFTGNSHPYSTSHTFATRVEITNSHAWRSSIGDATGATGRLNKDFWRWHSKYSRCSYASFSSVGERERDDLLLAIYRSSVPSLLLLSLPRGPCRLQIQKKPARVFCKSPTELEAETKNRSKLEGMSSL